jgi:hypothetical protein
MARKASTTDRTQPEITPNAPLRLADAVKIAWATEKFPTIADAETERPGTNRAFRVSLFLLLALRMSLIAMLGCSLRVLFGAARVLLALGVVALAVMFGGGTMSLGSIFVVFGSLVVFVLGHGILVGCSLPAGTNSPHPKTFQQAATQRWNFKN